MNNRNKAEKEALNLLDRVGYIEPPINAAEIAGQLGILVIDAKFKEQYNNISGLFNSKENKILINEEDSLNRKNFTIAHEVGHFILHQAWLKSNNYKPLFRVKNTFNEDEKEVEANIFAAHLLVPKKMLDKYYEKLTILELAILFGVSDIVIQKRIKYHYER